MKKQLSRRQALGLLGAGAAAVALPTTGTGAKTPTYPKGAIIRTILKDVPPSALGNGATLFHEHLSMTSPYPYQQPPPRPVPPNFTGNVDMMVEEMRGAGKDGLSCLVDGGHPDMGRSLDALRRIAMESAFTSWPAAAIIRSSPTRLKSPA